MKTKFFLPLILFCFFCSPMHENAVSPSVAQAEDTDFSLRSSDTNKAHLSQIMQSVLENQEKILIDIEIEQEKYKETLRDEIAALSKTRQDIYSSFNTLYSVYGLDKGHSAEMGLVAEQINRFIFQINEFYEPITHTKKQIQLRLQQLINLVDTLKLLDDPAVQPMLKRAIKLERSYSVFNTRLKTVTSMTQRILERLDVAHTEIEEKLPGFWYNYYIKQKIDFISQLDLLAKASFYEHIYSVAQLSLTRGIPSTLHAWLLLLTNVLLVIIPFLILGLIAQKLATRFVKEATQESCKKIIKATLIWIVLGITLQYASWHGGNRYQVISAIGTFMLCFGEIRLAWLLLSLKREKTFIGSSPFYILLSVLIVSFILLTFTDGNILLGFFWITFLTYILSHARKPIANFLPLSRILLYSFYTVIGISLFIVLLTGYVHLSFFIVLLYMCIVLGVHQARACLHATSLLNEFLPQSGMKALIYGLLLAISLPIVLTIALISPLGLLLAFPGGEYFIKTLGNFDINIGKISFNALQILSIATVFYLVKSIINVSCHYIDTTWSSHNNETLSSLTTPMKTTIFFGFWAIFVLYVLQNMGFNLSSLAVVAGGLSVGVGLGLQGIVQNTFSGFLLIYGQNIREGDMVDVGTVRGVVQKVSLRATRVRTFDNAIVFVPNSEFMRASFINWTHNGHKVRCTILVGVAYDSDLDLVKKTVLEVIQNDKRVASDPAPDIFFMDFAASALNFEVRFWVYNVMDQSKICSDIRFTMNAAFRKRGIQVPFPQTDIHVNAKTLELISESIQSKPTRRMVKRPVRQGKTANPRRNTFRKV